jgi:glycosyltransferase involved in cell wall biosynthesis
MDIMRGKGFECNCVFVGDGEMKNELMQEAKHKGLEQHVWFFGACYSEKKISELITNADICVSPGNIGLTAMHALAYGTPVITSNDFANQGPEFEAVIQGITGDFFVAGNAIDLSQRIISWLQMHQDREEVFINCYNEIDNYWTPEFKVNVIKEVIDR